MNQRTILIAAALLGALSVGLGAFATHALKSILIANGRLETFELAVRYQFYHTAALLAVGILCEKFPRVSSAGIFFIAGIVIFSGSLYILSLTGQTIWGAVTPLGGAALIAGWLKFAWAIYRQRPN